MNLKSTQISFLLILTISLFSFWAAFALLFINQWLYKDLPGYTIGRLCIWEGVAIIIAALIARWMINKWGSIQMEEIDGVQKITLHPNFARYFAIYFLIAVCIGIWQFWLFSQKF